MQVRKQPIQLPRLYHISHLWLKELSNSYPMWSRLKLEPIASQALIDFYRYVDAEETNNQFDLHVLFDPGMIEDQSHLTDIVHFFITLRTALRQSLADFDPPTTMMILEYLDEWQAVIISTYTSKLRQDNHPVLLEHQLTDLTKLNNSICALNMTLDSVSLFHATAQLTYSLMDADFCIVFQQDGDAMVSKASTGYIRSDHKWVNMSLLKTFKLLVVDDIRQDIPLDHIRAILGVDRIRAMISTTLQTGNMVFGKVVTIYTQPQHFTTQQIKLQQVFSQQASQAICNALLYESLGDQRTTQERQRIAREMHDTMFQSMVSLNIKLKVALQCIEREDWEQVKVLIEDARQLGKTAITNGRETLENLHTECKTCETMLDLIRPELTLFEEQTDIAPDLIVTGDATVLIPKALGHHIQRLLGEALNNVVRHAKATQVMVRLTLDEKKLQLEVTDDGVGFNPDKVDQRYSFGLIGMRGRANLIDADLQIESMPEQGTVVRICAPLSSKL